MKLIQRIFNSQRRHFEEGGRLVRFYPFFESMETIFFSPADVTREGPQVRDSLDVKRFMTIVILALIPHLLFGIYSNGFRASIATGYVPDAWQAWGRGFVIVLPLILVTYGVGFFWELVFAVVRKHSISEGLFVTCMLYPLTLPATIPLWQAALGISFGIVIGKEVFGGTGRNFLNPALTGRAFLFFAYPSQMSGDKVWTVVERAQSAAVDAFSGATPLAVAALTQNYEKIELSLAKAGYTFGTLFWGSYPGSIGATSTFLCLLGAVFLVAVGIASYRIIGGGVLGVLATGWVLNLCAGGASSAWMSLNPFYHLVMGGAAFGIAYMATDPVSAPDMNSAKWIYGFAIGSLTVLIRVFNPAYAEGVMLAILFMNLLAPLMDIIEVKARLKKRIPNV